MAEALYGDCGFYRRERPAAHFRTSVHASPLFAAALAVLAGRVDAALGRPERLDLVDVGAGSGELLAGIVAAVPAGLRDRLRPTAVEVAARPAGLPPGIGWTADIPEVTGLLIANEWLDNVPAEVVELTALGPHLVMVDQAGRESLGPAASGTDRAWLDAWWPLTEVGGRAEVGLDRDAAWAAAVGRVRRGVALAIDYAHTRERRAAGALRGGTLAAYRDGRSVRPIPDGSRDLTAHVALDACAAAAAHTGPPPDPAGTGPQPASPQPVAAAPAARLVGTLLTTQREALHALGIRGDRPPRALATTDPRAYLAALARAGQAAELTDPGGLGGFGWLVQSIGVPQPL